ncbi:hypothetical protein NDU88_002988 [Pleurodeles waltl]|uniref:Uncharacterized protein n=1 Tax=Pleurodeles waltl TaxID=8319 RepID=A0AAV7KV96_PLEWA|nr:hypothetical protein NDU88_002988 [Pleurodeles waltl]
MRKARSERRVLPNCVAGRRELSAAMKTPPQHQTQTSDSGLAQPRVYKPPKPYYRARVRGQLLASSPQHRASQQADETTEDSVLKPPVTAARCQDYPPFQKLPSKVRQEQKLEEQVTMGLKGEQQGQNDMGLPVAREN